MHTDGQKIHTTQGDTEHLAVVLNLANAPGLDIETCDFTWVAYKQTTGEIVLTKTTPSGITVDNSISEIVIHIDRDETDDLKGHYLHLCKAVDPDDNEYTVFTGVFDVDESPI